MKLIFEKPTSKSTTFFNNLLVDYWMYHGIHFDITKVQTSFNTVHNFWDVTIKRGVLYKQGHGHGSTKQQEASWQKNIDALGELHPATKILESSWSWEPITENVYTDGQELCIGAVFCPAVRIWFSV